MNEPDAEKKEPPSKEQPGQSAPATKADPKATYVDAEWKHDSPLIACRFDPLGRYVFSCAEDNTVQRWDLATGDKVVLKGHDSWPRDIVFTPDGRTTITSGSDDSLIWWDTAAESPQPLRKVAAHKGWVRCLSISPDGKLLASGGNDNLVKLWNIEDGSLAGQFAGHKKDVYSTLFHPSGKLLLSGDLAGQVHQWEVAGGKLVRTFDAKALHTYNGGQAVDYGGVRSMALSSDGKHLACAGLHKATNPLGAVNEPIVLLFDWESQKLLRSHTTGDIKGIAWRVLFHPGGFLIAASGGSGGGFILFWKTDEDKDFHRVKLSNTARGMDMHPDAIRLATVHHDRQIRISRMAAKPKTG